MDRAALTILSLAPCYPAPSAQTGARRRDFTQGRRADPAEVVSELPPAGRDRADVAPHAIRMRGRGRVDQQKVPSREMPPWYIDRHVGITEFKDDPSLTDAEIATIAKMGGCRRPGGHPRPRGLAPPAASVGCRQRAGRARGRAHDAPPDAHPAVVPQRIRARRPARLGPGDRPAARRAAGGVAGAGRPAAPRRRRPLPRSRCPGRAGELEGPRSRRGVRAPNAASRAAASGTSPPSVAAIPSTCCWTSSVPTSSAPGCDPPPSAPATKTGRSGPRRGTRPHHRGGFGCRRPPRHDVRRHLLDVAARQRGAGAATDQPRRGHPPAHVGTGAALRHP